MIEGKNWESIPEDIERLKEPMGGKVLVCEKSFGGFNVGDVIKTKKEKGVFKVKLFDPEKSNLVKGENWIEVKTGEDFEDFSNSFVLKEKEENSEAVLTEDTAEESVVKVGEETGDEIEETIEEKVEPKIDSNIETEEQDSGGSSSIREIFKEQKPVQETEERETNREEILDVGELNNLAETIKNNKDFFEENGFNTGAMQGNIDIALENIKNKKEMAEDLREVLERAIELAQKIQEKTEKKTTKIIKEREEGLATQPLESREDKTEKVEKEKGREELEEKLLQVDKLLSLYRDRGRFLLHLKNLRENNNANENEIMNAQAIISRVNYDITNLCKTIKRSDIEGFPEDEKRKIEEIMRAVEEGKMDYGKLVVRKEREEYTTDDFARTEKETATIENKIEKEQKKEPEPETPENVEPEIEAEIKREPRTTREVLGELELLEKLEMFERILKEKTRDLAEIEDYINNKKNSGKEITQEDKDKRRKALEEVQRADININTTRGVGASLEIENDAEDEKRILNKKIKMQQLLLTQFEVLGKIKGVEDKEVKKLNPEKQGMVRRLSSAVTDKGVKGIEKLQKLTHKKEADGDQQAPEPKKVWKGLWNYVTEKISKNKVEEAEAEKVKAEPESQAQESEENSELKNSVADAFLEILGKDEISKLFDNNNEEKIRIKDNSIEEILKELPPIYSKDLDEKELEKLKEKIKGFRFTRRDFEGARGIMDINEDDISAIEDLLRGEATEETKEKLRKFDELFNAEEFEKLKNIKKPSDLKPAIQLLEKTIDIIAEGKFPKSGESAKGKKWKVLQSKDLALNHYFDFAFDNQNGTKTKAKLSEMLVMQLENDRRIFTDLPIKLKNAEKYAGKVFDVIDGLRKEILEEKTGENKEVKTAKEMHKKELGELLRKELSEKEIKMLGRMVLKSQDQDYKIVNLYEKIKDNEKINSKIKDFLRDIKNKKNATGLTIKDLGDILGIEKKSVF